MFLPVETLLCPYSGKGPLCLPTAFCNNLKLKVNHLGLRTRLAYLLQMLYYIHFLMK